MEARAVQKYVKVSPFKARKLISLVKGKPVLEALAILDYLPHRAAHHIWKAIHSASMNLVNKAGELKVKEENIFVESIHIEEGPFLKRVRPMSMGRAGLIRRRTSHITVVVKEKTGGDIGAKD